MTLNQVDPEIYETINKEKKRQSSNINLIASENYASAAVLEAQGSVFSNKYAEGYPGNRYYGGCEYVDIAENLAIERAKPCLSPITPMSNLIVGHKPTWQLTSLVFHQGTQYLVWDWSTAVILPMAVK